MWKKGIGMKKTLLKFVVREIFCNIFKHSVLRPFVCEMKFAALKLMIYLFIWLGNKNFPMETTPNIH